MSKIEEQYFTQHDIASKYDSYIGLNMPFYRPAIEFLADAVVSHYPGKVVPRVVEIGVGSGNLGCATIPRLRVDHLCIIDHSGAFLRIAQRKFLEAITYPLTTFMARRASFADEGWSDGIPENGADLALSSFTFDHIADSSLPKVYRDVHAILRPGGIFTIAEKCASGDKQSVSWSSYVRAIDIRTEHNRIHGLKTEEEIVAWRHHNFHDDQMRPLSAHIRTLEKAGFSILTIAGVPLRPAQDMTYEDFYALTKIEPLTRQFTFDTDLAFGVGILVCQK
jgi:SAM-dependent methyltransferase